MAGDKHKTKGYLRLSDAEIALMEDIREKGYELRDLIIRLECKAYPVEGDPNGVLVDPRWLNIGKTHLQQGIMALKRSVSKSQGF